MFSGCSGGHGGGLGWVCWYDECSLSLSLSFSLCLSLSNYFTLCLTMTPAPLSLSEIMPIAITLFLTVSLYVKHISDQERADVDAENVNLICM